MYSWTQWLDHVTDLNNIFVVKEYDASLDQYTITKAGTIMQQGTAQDQNHFNNLECGVLDSQIGTALVLTMIRQNGWALDDLKDVVDDIITIHQPVQSGTIVLRNTLEYPFNDSKQTIALTTSADNADYEVVVEPLASRAVYDADVSSMAGFYGNIGEVEVSAKLVNGFKLEYTGSAAQVQVKYTVWNRGL